MSKDIGNKIVGKCIWYVTKSKYCFRQYKPFFPRGDYLDVLVISEFICITGQNSLPFIHINDSVIMQHLVKK